MKPCGVPPADPETWRAPLVASPLLGQRLCQCHGLSSVSPPRWPRLPGTERFQVPALVSFSGPMGCWVLSRLCSSLRAPLAGRLLGRRAVSPMVLCPRVSRAGQGRCPAVCVPWVSRTGLSQPPPLRPPSLLPGSPGSAVCLTTSVLERPRAWALGGAFMRRALRLSPPAPAWRGLNPSPAEVSESLGSGASKQPFGERSSGLQPPACSPIPGDWG